MSHIDDLLGIAALATLGWSAALWAPQLLPAQADARAPARNAALAVPAQDVHADDARASSLPSAPPG